MAVVFLQGLALVTAGDEGRLREGRHGERDADMRAEHAHVEASSRCGSHRPLEADAATLRKAGVLSGFCACLPYAPAAGTVWAASTFSLE